MISKNYVVIAIVHYTIWKNGMDHGFKTVTLHLRSLYEVAAIPDHIDLIEQTDITMSDSTIINAIHLYDEHLPVEDINFSLYNYESRNNS
jgi:hypothetical protein